MSTIFAILTNPMALWLVIVVLLFQLALKGLFGSEADRLATQVKEQLHELRDKAAGDKAEDEK